MKDVNRVRDGVATYPEVARKLNVLLEALWDLHVEPLQITRDDPVLLLKRILDAYRALIS